MSVSLAMAAASLTRHSLANRISDAKSERTTDQKRNHAIRLSYFGPGNVPSRCAGADEIKHLTGSYRKIFRRVRREICSRRVSCDYGGAADGRPDGQGRNNPNLVGLSGERCRELRCIGLRGCNLRDYRPTEP